MDDLTFLIARAQKEDKNAFGEIYRLFYDRIFRYLKFQTRQEALAQDLCQETFLRAWKSIGSFSQKKGGSFQAFLFKIAHNLLVDYFRKNKETPIGDRDFSFEENHEEEMDKKESIKNLELALLKLDNLDRQIVTLRYFEELSFEEIAKTVGIKEGALRVRVHRVIQKVKDMIGEGSNEY